MPQRRIRNVIDSQLILAAPSITTVLSAARMMKDRNFGSLMVTEDGTVTGIFTERDALFRVIAEGLDPATTAIGSVMTPNPQTIHPDRPVGHALHMMFEGGFRHVPVVENGRPIGMVSSRDALGPELIEFTHELETRDHIADIL
jgi:CBS domain-containing protein